MYINYNANNIGRRAAWVIAKGSCPNFAVYGDILKKYSALGGASSFLGCPTTSETGTPDGIGRYNHFQGGSIYWTAKTGAFEVHGDIRAKWASVGWERGYGYPTTDELVTPDGTGRFNHFTDGRSIYWTAQTGAHFIYGEIRNKWAAMGWERSILKYPTTDELGTPDGVGRYNQFQGGAIYWTAKTGAHEVHGDIKTKWASVGWEKGFGYPTTDELATPDGRGRFNHFTDGRSIYWTPQTGAHLIYGVIREKWASLGWERSALGYPTTDEMDSDRGDFKRMNKFEKGTIYWRPDLTQVVMK
jgi:uncharacterized protein with LGFP repeats